MASASCLECLRGMQASGAGQTQSVRISRLDADAWPVPVLRSRRQVVGARVCLRYSLHDLFGDMLPRFLGSYRLLCVLHTVFR